MNTLKAHLDACISKSSHNTIAEHRSLPELVRFGYARRRPPEPVLKRPTKPVWYGYTLSESASKQVSLVADGRAKFRYGCRHGYWISGKSHSCRARSVGRGE